MRRTCLAVGVIAGFAPLSAQTLPTPAEATEFRRGPTMYEPMMEFIAALQAQSPLLSVSDVAETPDDHRVILCALSDPPVRRPADAANAGKPIVLIVSNVHGGEVAGKDATLMLLRDLAIGEHRGLLREVVVLIVPNVNPDGAERRQRTNTQGLDLNRDYLKLESPEIRGLVTRVINPWQPHVHVDTHNGGSAPYTLVYQTCMNPAGDAELIRIGNEQFLPAVQRRLRAADYDGYWYSGPRREGEDWRWVPTSVEPRKQHVYSTMANMIGFLFETPSGTHRIVDGGERVVEIPNDERYRHQVMGQYLGQLAIVEHTAAQPKETMAAIAAAMQRATENGASVSDDDTLVIDYEQVAKFEDDFWVRDADGEAGYRKVRGQVMTRFDPTMTITRPWGYLLPAKLTGVVDALLDHEISVIRLDDKLKAEVDALYATEVTQRRPYQGHQLRRVVTEARREEKKYKAGAFFVPMAQPKSNLIGYLLEPDTNDSLATWNYLDDYLRVTRRRARPQAVPIARVMQPIPIVGTVVEPPAR